MAEGTGSEEGGTAVEIVRVVLCLGGQWAGSLLPLDFSCFHKITTIYITQLHISLNFSNVHS